jgi:FlaA1/EpsC-like NDP-sugar epimerase
MSVYEAVQLVLESSVLSDGGGEIFMLEMGKPVRILDLAERMIRLSGFQVGVDIPIHLVGMRPGEKLEEELRTPEEESIHTQHPYINQLIPITAPADAFAEGLRRLEQATTRRDREAARGLLFTVGSAKPDERPSALTEKEFDFLLTEAPEPAAARADGGADYRRGEVDDDSSSSEQIPA